LIRGSPSDLPACTTNKLPKGRHRAEAFLHEGSAGNDTNRSPRLCYGFWFSLASSHHLGACLRALSEHREPQLVDLDEGEDPLETEAAYEMGVSGAVRYDLTDGARNTCHRFNQRRTRVHRMLTDPRYADRTVSGIALEVGLRRHVDFLS
jgi:hypothetical protein